MAFKLGNEKRQIRNSKNTPIFRKKLKGGTLAEANMDGSIVIDNSVKPGSAFERRIIKHEKKHIEQIKSGRAGYTDKHVMWEGKKYERKNGKIKYKGKWYPEGEDKNLPWEIEAKKAETK
tara:strand:- start:66 stop:425 length:360 start_codon:yes stop_codon:yes gene_type:complete